MGLADYGIGRREKRQRYGTTGEDHFDELVGSSEFYIYLTPQRKAKGYEELRLYLQSLGCEVVFPSDAPVSPGKQYQAVRVTYKEKEIPTAGLRRAHQWAHQRDLLHSFFRPLL